MTTIATGSARLYQTLTHFKRAYADSLMPVIASSQRRILAAQDSSGKIPEREAIPLAREIGKEVQRFFVGTDGRSAYDPTDGRTALARYPDLLNRALVLVTDGVVKPHTRYLEQRLPDDIRLWLKSAHRFREQAPLVPFRPNPLAVYDPMHTWVDARGYTLSDRIWQNSLRIRTQIDALISTAIREGRSARDLARDLEQFLLPTRAPFRTRRPYGQDGSYDAMRLARSEITRAHSAAAQAAGIGNPFVEGMDFALSPQHPKYDICDKLASIGEKGERLKPAYGLTDVPIPVQDTHPLCLCRLQAFVTASSDDVVAALRAAMEAGELPPLTAVNADNFVIRLLGRWSASLVSRLRQLPNPFDLFGV